MGRLVVSVADLSNNDIDDILTRARRLASRHWVPPGHRRILGLLFLEASLRTRVGFEAAALRLGWSAFHVDRIRSSPTSSPERWEDTLRVVSGYSDVVIIRPNAAVDAQTFALKQGVSVLNGGDCGPRAEHPSQALVDLFYIGEQRGDINGLCIGICGDPRMRTVRSLVALLDRCPPKRLVHVWKSRPQEEPAPLPTHIEERRPWQIEDLDVLYVAGIPHESMPLSERETLLVDDQALKVLPADAIVLSPLPIIDEITPKARQDPRVRIFDQSDHGMFVRAAILELLAGSD